MEKESSIEIVKEIKLLLSFAYRQADEGNCTYENLVRWRDILAEALNVDASISDLSEHFGKSEANVSNIISRKMTAKPKRKVLYRFADFLKIIPKSWK